MRRPLNRLALCAAAMVLIAGCSAAPEPQSSQAPPRPADPVATPRTLVSGAADTTGSIPGTADAPYIYRFKQTTAGGSAFTFRDRDVSFSFRPSPVALHFQVMNLQGRPVWIDWDHSQFVDPNGRSGKIAHESTRWRDRFNPQALTQVPGQQTYSDFTFPMDNLVDPGAATSGDEQPHQPLLPEDSSAPSYSDKEFGMDLVLMIEDKPRTYPFRFQVVSVIPR